MCRETGKVVVRSAIIGIELGGLIAMTPYDLETIGGRRILTGCTGLDRNPEAIVEL